MGHELTDVGRADDILESIDDEGFADGPQSPEEKAWWKAVDKSPWVTLDMPIDMAYELKNKDAHRMPSPGETRFNSVLDAHKAGKKIDPIIIGSGYMGGKYGPYKPPSVDDGHHRIMVAKHMGLKIIPAKMKRL